MMQSKLFANNSSYVDKTFAEMYGEFKKENNYKKIVTGYGNKNSKLMIIGESCVMSHYNNPKSYKCFCFDINSDRVVDNKSGSILIRVFNEQGIEINNFYWTNVFKIPFELLENDEEKSKHYTLLQYEINLISPDIIICLGTNAYNIVKDNIKLYDAKLKRIYHPAYYSRNPHRFSEYIEKWRNILK